ncbi:MAG: thiE2 [Bacteroidota bacterium]|jgi:thiamine-phosphate pyrophosphorylase|nr:thiE2 [Bacteroidota bacterium]
MLHKLHYISQGDTPAAHVLNISTALDSGIKLVQLRLKHITDERYTEYALKAQELCKQYNAHLVVNDNALVSKLSNSSVLHLGLEDMSITDAKNIVPSTLIGGTANTFDHVQQRCADQVDYIGLGPYRFTTTKKKLSPVLGLEGYNTIMGQMKKQELTTPVYAIGGIEFEDIAPLMKTGVYGIAVSGLITHSKNKEQLIKEINKIIYHA